MNIIKATAITLSLVLSIGTNASFAANRTTESLNLYNKHLGGDYTHQYVTPKNKSYSLALKFVRSAGLHKSLSLLLLDSVKNDAVVEKAISLHGFENVKNSVVHNIQSTTMLYRSQWMELLAGLYSDQFNAAVMRSILEEGEKSPHFTAFINKQHKVGTDQILINSTLFKEARSKLIDNLKLNFTAMVH